MSARVAVVDGAPRFVRVNSKAYRSRCVTFLYKTKLCIHWSRVGKCASDYHCAFAHGDNELRCAWRNRGLPIRLEWIPTWSGEVLRAVPVA
jgi:hypothetical protein